MDLQFRAGDHANGVTTFHSLSGRPGSNRRHSAWKADALPTELLPLLIFTILGMNLNIYVGRAGFEPAKVKPTDLQSVLVGRLSISPIKFILLKELEPIEGLLSTALKINFSSQNH